MSFSNFVVDDLNAFMRKSMWIWIWLKTWGCRGNGNVHWNK